MDIHYLSVIGLLLIAAGWLMQYLRMEKGKQDIVPGFVAINCLGIALLVYDSFATGLADVAAMNVLTLAASILVFSRLKRK